MNESSTRAPERITKSNNTAVAPSKAYMPSTNSPNKDKKQSLIKTEGKLFNDFENMYI